MASAVEAERVAEFFHKAAASEELCEEALRCQSSPVSSHIYRKPFASPNFSTAIQSVCFPSSIAGWGTFYAPLPSWSQRSSRSRRRALCAGSIGRTCWRERASALETAGGRWEGRMRVVGVVGIDRRGAPVGKLLWR